MKRTIINNYRGTTSFAAGPAGSRSTRVAPSRGDGRTRRSLRRIFPFGARLAGCIRPDRPSCLAPAGRSL